VGTIDFARIRAPFLVKCSVKQQQLFEEQGEEFCCCSGMSLERSNRSVGESVAILGHKEYNG
jgi:hypothetical protein